MHEALSAATCIHIVVGFFPYLSHEVGLEEIPPPLTDGALYAARAQSCPAQAQLHDFSAEKRLSSEQCPVDTAAKESRHEMYGDA